MLPPQHSDDALDRLTSGRSGSETYGTFPAHGAVTLGNVPNQYASYDAMGNMTCRNVDTTSGHGCDAAESGAIMTYDNEGRLDTWVAPNGTVASDHFLYDNSGQRVLQRASNTVGSTTTTSDTISFDGYTDVTITGGTTSTTKYYSVGGQRVAMRQNGTFSYLMPDFLGSNSIALRSDGSVQAVQLFSPFGATRYSDGTMLSPFNFTGQRLDTQTGLLYYGARYYDVMSGRFISADTVETNGSGLDPYAYVRGNPETATDPTGHFRAMNDVSGSSTSLSDWNSASTAPPIYSASSGGWTNIYTDASVPGVLVSPQPPCDYNCETGNFLISSVLIDLALGSLFGPEALAGGLLGEAAGLAADGEGVPPTRNGYGGEGYKDPENPGPITRGPYPTPYNLTKQTYRMSCTAACAVMKLLDAGVTGDNATEDGAIAGLGIQNPELTGGGLENLPFYLSRNGVDGYTFSNDATIDDLETSTSHGNPAVASIGVGINKDTSEIQLHSIIVDRIDSENVYVRDPSPLIGNGNPTSYSISLSAFAKMFSERAVFKR
ncbi:RHS repeat-associated core domain-containing protein [Dictyobacter kobayashii]|uniref:RHS repeat-associated core domain-containing protein n=1 Tax=Dictyobacter kobayashii TaxID=2014872 RepID=UPI001386D0F5|nr:RHS repeat-associated core domain-containing protein [Dictyobacter kobayashii]